MSLPTSEPVPPADDSAQTTPPATPSAKRRHERRRMVIPTGSSAQAAFLKDLAHRVTPSLDFYLFTLLAGLALGIAIITDSPAFFVLAALLSPFMAPVVGLSFSTVLSSARFIGRMTGAITVGSALIFGWGALTGWVARLWPELRFDQTLMHARFTWPDLAVLVLGAGLTAYALVRAPGQRPLVTSVAIAYEVYLPAGVAGFGLTSGIVGLWPQALLLYLLNLALAALTGALVLLVLGLKPLRTFGYFFGACLAAVALAALVTVNGSGMRPAPLIDSAPPAIPLPSETAVAPDTQTPVPLVASPQETLAPSPSLTPTQAPSFTPTNSLVPSRTPTVTDTPVPTPMWAFIAASSGGGALVRTEPGFDKPLVKTLLNGLLVEVLPEEVRTDNVTWVKIRTPKGDVEGWIVRSLLTTSTPEPAY